MSRGATALLVAALGCGPKPAVDSTIPSGSPTAGPTAGTAPGSTAGTTAGTEPSGFAPTVYTVVYGVFGVTGGQATELPDVDLFGTPIRMPLQLAVRLGDDTLPDGPTPDNHCDVVLTTYAAQPPAAWTAAAGAWFAVQFPGDAAITDANCDTLELHPAWADPAATVAAARWGLAVGALTQADLDALGATTGSSGMSTWLGGRWWTDAAAGPVGGGALGAPGIAAAHALDGSGGILRDADHDAVPIDASAVPSAGGVVDGYYTVTPLGPWRPISELAAR